MIDSHLLKILLDDKPTSLSRIINMTNHQTGPGYLDSWRLLFEDKKDCWQRRELSTIQSKHKKIIFSNAMLSLLERAAEDIEIVNALIRDYEVYLWADKIIDSVPLADADEFWRKLSKCKAASAQKVYEKLSDHAVATSDYIVIDLEKFFNIKEQLYNIRKKNSLKQQMVSEKQSVTNTDIPFARTDSRFILDSVEKSEQPNINCVMYNPSSEEIDFIADNIKIPKATVYLDPRFNIKPKKLLQDCTAHLKVKYFQEKVEVNLFATKTLLSLSRWINHVDIITPDTNLHVDLEIKFPPLTNSFAITTTVNFDQANHLTRLKISSLMKFDISPCTKLKELVYDYGASSVANHLKGLSSCKNLEKVSLRGADDNTVKELSSIKNLKTVILKHISKDCDHINFSKLTNLKKLSLSYLQKVKTVILPESLEELSLKYGSCLIDLDLSALPNLKKLIILNCNKIENITFHPHNKLHTLDLCRIKSPLHINFNILQKLKNLDLMEVNLTLLDLSNSIELNSICLVQMKLNILSLIKCSQLKKIKAVNSSIKEIEHDVLSELEEVEIFDAEPVWSDKSYKSPIGNLDFKKIPNVKILNLNVYSIKKIIADIQGGNLDQINLYVAEIFSDLKFMSNVNAATIAGYLSIDTFNNALNLQTIDLNLGAGNEEINLSHSRNLATVNLLLFSDVKSTIAFPVHVKSLQIDFNLKMNSQIMLHNIVNLQKLTIKKGRLSNLSQIPKNIKSLTLTDIKEIYDLDFSEYFSLEELYLHNLLSGQIIQIPPNLKKLEISNFTNPAVQVDLSNAKSLEELTMVGCRIKHIKLPDGLVSCSLFNTKVTDSIALPDNLKQFEAIGDKEPVNTITLAINPTTQLEIFKIAGCVINDLSLINWKKIRLIECEYNSTMVIINCDELESIRLIYKKLIPSSLIIKNLNKLKNLHIKGDWLNSVKIAQCYHLDSLKMNVPSIAKISINECPKVNNLDIAAPFDAVIIGLDKLQNLKWGRNVKLNAGNKHVNSNIKQQLQSRPKLTITHPTSVVNEQIPSRTIHNELPKRIITQVSRINIRDLLSPLIPNTITGEMQAHKANGNYVSSIYPPNPEGNHNHRIGILDDLKLDSTGNVCFLAKHRNKNKKIPSGQINYMPQSDLVKLTEMVDRNNSLSLTYLQIELDAGEIYPITSETPIINPDDIKIFSENFHNIEVLYDEELQQAFVRLKNGCKKSNINLSLLYTKDLTYHTSRSLSYKEQPLEHLLPKKLIAAIERKLKGTHLHFLFNKSCTLEDKISRLKKYCEKFDMADLDNDLIKEMGVFFAPMMTVPGKGSCHHRSNTFMVLSRYLGVPTRMVINEKHQFCEIPSLKINVTKQLVTHWQMVELGGSPVIDQTLENDRIDPFANVKKNDRSTDAMLPVVPLASSDLADFYLIDKPPSNDSFTVQRVQDQESIQFYQKLENHVAELKYQKLMNNYVKIEEAKSLVDILNNTRSSAPLIQLTGNQSAYDIDLIITNYIEKHSDLSKNDYIFINTPSDFKLYLSSYTLKDGKRHCIDGPLKKLIEKGGVLVVNWTNFTPTEIASYKSILDTTPTLLGSPVSSRLKVIGITNQDKDVCSAFLSRIKRYSLHNEFFKFDDKAIMQHEKVKPLQVDLFNKRNWRELLIANIIFDNDRIILHENKLMKGIRKDRPIIIYNPPHNDPSFEYLVHQVNKQKRIFFNGQFYDISDNVHITLANKPHVNSIEQVDVIKESDTDNRKKIFLNLNNIDECWNKISFNINNQASTLDGHFKNYHSKTHVFYITDKIPLGDWQALLHGILEAYPNKKFDFMIAPGASIEDVCVNDAPVRVSDAEENLFITNDPDLKANQLIQKYSNDNCIVVDVTPETSYSNLIAKLKVQATPSDLLEFTYQEKFLITSLSSFLEKKTIILNGQLSPALYQQLLPFFTQQSVFVNGNEIKPEGLLISVQPLSALDILPFKQVNRTDYTWDDYTQHLSVDDKVLANDLITFIKLGNNLPHRGAGRPHKLEVNYRRFHAMLDKIKHKKSADLHQHNVIKGLVNYDYPKSSEDYAYLNVIGKYLFHAKDNSQPRFNKINEILKGNNITQPAELLPHVWSILNCFNGYDLHQLLGDNLLDAINVQSSFPLISNLLLTKIFNKVITYPVPEEEIKTSHVLKRTAQLKSLINNPSVPFIFLKGPPGAGKSYTIRELKGALGFLYFEGVEGILDWLKPTNGQKRVLLLDEANMRQPGTFDFLKGLDREKKKITYKGITYPLSDDHKIISTGNAESYPERHYHSLFQQYFETLQFLVPDDDYLENTVLATKLSLSLRSQENKSRLFKSYQLIKQYNPAFRYSIRDIENLVARFNALNVNVSDSVAIEENILKAAVSEFAGMIRNTNDRQNFIQALYETLNMVYKPVYQQDLIFENVDKNLNIIIPAENAHLVSGIEQDLAMRENALKQSSIGYFKQGVLIEGEAGLGKSKTIKLILEKNGFTSTASDTQSRYYEISAGQYNVKEILKEAFHNGSIVILDELNLDPLLEPILNQYLTGTDLNGSPPVLPGFTVLATQNPSHYAGRKSVSQALRNRMHIMYMDNYSDKTLVKIATHYKLNNPESFVKVYLKMKDQYPNIINMRTFYKLIADLTANPALLVLGGKIEPDPTKSKKQEQVYQNIAESHDDISQEMQSLLNDWLMIMEYSLLDSKYQCRSQLSEVKVFEYDEKEIYVDATYLEIYQNIKQAINHENYDIEILQKLMNLTHQIIKDSLTSAQQKLVETIQKVDIDYFESFKYNAVMKNVK